MLDRIHATKNVSSNEIIECLGSLGLFVLRIKSGYQEVREKEGFHNQ